MTFSRLLAGTLIMLALCVPSVLSVSIGISPGRVDFSNILEGGYAEREVTITTDSEGIVFGHLAPHGEIQEWLSFRPNRTDFNTSRFEPYKLTIIIEPPADMQNGNYSGTLEFVADSVGSIGGRAGGVVKAAVIMRLNSEISGFQIIECRAGAFSVADAEVDFPIEIGTRIINDGNVRLTPTLSVDIWDQEQRELVYSDELEGDEILPTTSGRVVRRLPNPLAIGQYWIDLGVDECATADTLTFSVVEKGGIADKGEFRDIFHKPWAVVGETVEFVAKFSNQGSRAVSAQFKGNIRYDDSIVEVIETDEILIPSGQTGDFNIFFTPQQQGRYVLSGRVIYNKKLTFERSAILNVEPSTEEPESTVVPLLIYLAIIIGILFILRKIVKERRKQRPF
jgi:hypothetical protein